MSMLTSEITKLLDKLYNLRGEDSVVLQKMEKERQTAEETKERTTKEKSSLQERIEKLTSEERVLAEEGEKLVAALRNIKSDDFKVVLEKLNINFNPDVVSSEVNALLPTTIEKIQNEKASAKDELVKIEEEMNEAVATMEELAIRKDEAVANQARLNEYFDLALNGNINITRDSITSLLEKFEFSDDEQREAAKILMFPEDALYEYDKEVKNALQSGKSISEVFAEAKAPANDFNMYSEEEIKIPSIEQVKESSPREDLENLLKDLGFEFLDFTNNDIEKILANYNEQDLRRNVEYAKSKGLNLDMFVDNIELLYDKEFIEKSNRLLEIGKEPFDIYLNPSALLKYSMKDLDDTIENLKSGGLDPRLVPLIAF